MFDPNQAVVIANPTSGDGFVGAQWGALGQKMQAILGPVTLRQTESMGHATALARDAVSGGATTIISLGGDGTHSEVVDGIMQSEQRSEVSLGILHAGTGGDFRKMVPNADDLELGCHTILATPGRPIDVGWVEYAHDDGHRASRFFLNITSMGMSGLVDRHVAASTSKRGGTSKYLVATIRAQLEYKPARIRLRIDGQDRGEYDISVICVCNGRWAGGGMMFAPEARIADGEFDIVVMRAVSTLRGLPVMAGLYKGTHVRSNTVDTFRGKHVEVEVAENTAYMDIDGEAPGTGPAEFRLHEGALRVIGVGPEFV
ncbi:MAG: diacylglycerol kinase family protein [Myxococcota bacterium]